jgi:tetratricopeptide (TPR) repeat protein
MGLAMNIGREDDVKTILDFKQRLLPAGRYVVLMLIIVFVGILSFFSIRVAVADFYSLKGKESALANNFEAATSSFEKAVYLNPWDADYAAWLGKLYHDTGVQTQESGWFYKAIEVYQSQLRINSFDARLHYRMGDAYYALEKIRKTGAGYSLAKESFERTVELDPLFSEAQFKLGTILMMENSYFQAIEHFDKALEVSPNNADALYGLGLAYGRIGQIDKAIEYFGRVLKIDPDYPGARENLELLATGG